LVLATLCVERAVSLWGTPEAGKASAQARKTARLAESAPLLARHGVAPDASLDIAAAAFVTADTRAALGDPLLITRFPAT
jgi:hypothetical protein